MEDKGIAPVTLEYAVENETGDLAASRVLIRIVRAIIWTHLLFSVAGLLVFAVYAARFGTNMNWWTVLSIAFAVAQCALLLRCLKALKRNHSRGGGIFYITFLMILIQPATTLAWNWTTSTTIATFLTAGTYLAATAVEHCYLLLVPLLRGRESGAWLQRLTWIAIGVLALSMVPWLTNNALRYFYPSMRGLYEPTFIRPTWVQAGILVSIVALFAFRHEHNRVLLRLVAAWWVLFVATNLYESHFWMRFTYGSSWIEVLPILSEMLRDAACTIPFAMLAWFTFRFTDAQRKEMGRRVVMAEN